MTHRQFSVPELAELSELTRTRTRPRCACFSACNQRETADFFLRLPRYVSSAASPWVAYFEAVYHEPPPLPVALHEFEAFHSLHLPAQRCHKRNLWFEPLPQCAASKCHAWLPGQRPTASEVDAFLRTRSVPMPDSSSLIVAQRPVSNRTHPPRGQWLEVLRTPASLLMHKGKRLFPEGASQYGCWFLPARGAGLFVNVGRVGTQRTFRSASRKYRRFMRNSYAWDDMGIAEGGRREGYDSVHVLESNAIPFGTRTAVGCVELIVVKSECMDGAAALPTACFPLEARGGWGGGANCSCVDVSYAACASRLGVGSPLQVREREREAERERKRAEVEREQKRKRREREAREKGEGRASFSEGRRQKRARVAPRGHAQPSACAGLPSEAGC